MNSFELNKIIGAVLGTLLFVMGVGFVAEIVYSPIENRGPGYSLPEPAGERAAVAETKAPAEEPLGVLLASASPEQGQSAVRKCQSCHNFGQGEGNKTGPELYGVVGRVIGSHPGFAYSEDMQARNAAGDTWTYEALNKFLTAPKADMPGTKMNFAGVKSPKERANILAYLATLSPTPLPFPPPEVTATEAPAAEAPAAPAETPAAPAETPAAEAPAQTPAVPAETPAAEAPVQPPAAPASEAVALLPTASAERGQAVARKCQACHTFGEGEGNKAGPALYGVVGRVIGTQEGFKYSDIMRDHAAAGDTWTYEALDAFLEAPRTNMPGTKMGFAGVKAPQERADLLAYLATLSPSPVPFPTAGANTAPAVPTIGDAVATPTETQGETPVEGTPTTSGTGGTPPTAPAGQ